MWKLNKNRLDGHSEYLLLLLKEKEEGVLIYFRKEQRGAHGNPMDQVNSLTSVDWVGYC
jgi:hypothetical protein